MVSKQRRRFCGRHEHLSNAKHAGIRRPQTQGTYREKFFGACARARLQRFVIDLARFDVGRTHKGIAS